MTSIDKRLDLDLNCGLSRLFFYLSHLFAFFAP